jgi:predicted deacylase
MLYLLIVIIIVLIILIHSIIFDYYGCADPTVHIFQSKINKRYPYVTILGGTHGNEPAGSDYLMDLIRKLESEKMTINRGTLVIIPNVNRCGLALGIRSMPSLLPIDINRSYGSDGQIDPIKKYIHHINRSDLVVDLHEGHDYAVRNSQSVGSGIYSHSNDQMIFRLLDRVNRDIEWDKKFITKYLKPIKGTLKEYCRNMDKRYILVETTGQNNIQPIKLRVKQMKTIVGNILKDLAMIA